MQAGERAKRSVVVLFLVFGLGAAAGCNKLKARDLLNRGVEDYKAGQFDQAIEKFKQAADLDPNLVTARLYLATAYASQFIPGAPSEENRRKGEQAIEEFRRVLEKDPNNLSAIDGIGSMLFNMGTTPYNPKLLEESKKYHLEHIRLAPNYPQPYYWVGVIDWTLAYRANREMREKYNANLPRRGKPIKEDEPLPASLREQFANQYQAIVEEGIQELNKALELKPDYVDAMAYLNLLYRQKADMVESAEERQALLRQADALVDRIKEIKQKEGLPKTS